MPIRLTVSEKMLFTVGVKMNQNPIEILMIILPSLTMFSDVNTIDLSPDNCFDGGSSVTLFQAAKDAIRRGRHGSIKYGPIRVLFLNRERRIAYPYINRIVYQYFIAMASRRPVFNTNGLGGRSFIGGLAH